jgi:hypothetical protein
LRRIPSLCIAASIALLCVPAASALIQVSPTQVVIKANIIPAMTVEPVWFTASVNSDSQANGTLDFTLDSVPISGCTNVPLVPATPTSSIALCTTTSGAAGTRIVGGAYAGDPYHAGSSGTLPMIIVPSLPISATVTDPCGSFTVTGATQNGNTVTNFTGNTQFQLGACVSPSPFVVTFDHLNVAPGAQILFRPGIAGQHIVLNATLDVNPQIVAGALRAIGITPSDVPPMQINAPNGFNVRSTGVVDGAAGLTLDLLKSSFTIGSPLINEGVVNGGVKLEIFASEVHGGGDFDGNDSKLHVFGNANHPVHGNDFLQNYLSFNPGTGVAPLAAATAVAAASPDILFTLNAYGPAPQFVNFKFNGNASMWMPSQWPSALQFPPNNHVLAPNEVRPAGTPEPAYGGGSMIVHATGSLVLFGGGPAGSHDFVFPGAIVMISDQWIDLMGTIVNQGWTGNGKAFQGIFFKAPIIEDSSGRMTIYGNALNWINMSTMPVTPVSAFTLQTNNDGSQSFAPSDGVSTHLNDYVYISNIAVAGGCWVCAVNTTPVNMSAP